METKIDEELPEADWDELKGPSQGSSDGVDPNMPTLSDIASDDEDFKSALGDALEPEKQKCENCGFMNSLQDFYCSICKFALATQGTTPMQREKLTCNTIENALAEYGLYWRPLTHRGIPSLRAKTRKEARSKVGRTKEWGKKNGRPWIETVEDRWDYD